MGLIKTEQQITSMREGGKILGEMLKNLKEMLTPGRDCIDLENSFMEMCREYKVTPSCKNYAPRGMPPFPTGLCLSINSQCVHCFPTKGVILKDNDVVTIDTVIKHKGMNVDAAVCAVIGKSEPVKKNLVETADKALDSCIKEIKHGVKIGKISHKMEKIVKSSGLNVLKDFAGHGIGEEMHEYPEIPCYGNKNDGPRLLEGMTICVESLICTGDDLVLSDSAWETHLADGGYFAQSEHTILVTKNGFEILTKA